MRQKVFRVVSSEKLRQNAEISKRHFELLKMNFSFFFRFLYFYPSRLILIRRAVTNQRALDSFEFGEHFMYT